MCTRGALRQRRVLVVTDRSEYKPHNDAYWTLAYDIRSVYIVSEISNPKYCRDLGEAMLSFVRGSDIDEIHIAVEWKHWASIKVFTEVLRAVPLPVRLRPDEIAIDIATYSPAMAQGTITIELQRDPLTIVERRLKRAIDIVVSTLSLFLLGPLLLAIAFAIRLDSPGPIFFRQTRRGFNGRTFMIYKFRSMHVLEDGASVAQVKENDVRVTRLGKFLRRSSLDELPQLFNVFLGEMSLVGPRPHAVAHDDYYTRLVRRYADRHHTKPGITGWAQVNGYRGETATIDRMEQRIRHDLWYIANWSIWLDLWIMCRTVVELARSRNAH
jgi:putative colanic acid biosynthesis UDP-glucose lipid carrier transferase